MRDRAEIGIFGGSGFYSFLENVELIQVETPFGLPSDDVAIGKVGDRNVAFIHATGASTRCRPLRSTIGPTCGPSTRSA